MSKSRKRRKSSVNDAYLIVIAICALSFVVAIKQIFISISTSISNLSNSAQLSLIIVTTISIALVLYLKYKHINFRDKNRHFSNIDYMKLSTYEFEKFCADLLNQLNYHVKVTPPKADGGKDLIGTDPTKQKIYGEVKQWTSTNVGRPLLQKLKGAMVDANIKQGIFITTSKFSKQALEYAKRNNIKCIDRSELNKLIAKADKQIHKSIN